MYEVSYAFSLQGIVQMVMRKLLEILFQSASLVIDTIRTLSLIHIWYIRSSAAATPTQVKPPGAGLEPASSSSSRRQSFVPSSCNIADYGIQYQQDVYKRQVIVEHSTIIRHIRWLLFRDN